MDKIYIFSGLGVDKRVFQNINFQNLDVEFVDWITPLKKESLKSYALRISQKITVENPTLIGLSFGGILAVEISKIRKIKTVILIASAKNKNELPIIYRIAGKLKINKLIPSFILKQQNFLTDWLFGIQTETEKKLLKSILKDTDSNFLLWAVDEIANWKNKTNPENFIHIHGDKDYIIPLRNVKSNYIIKNGGHFMTVNKASDIERIIHEVCSQIKSTSF